MPEMPGDGRDRWSWGESHTMSEYTSSSCMKHSGMCHYEGGTKSARGVVDVVALDNVCFVPLINV